MPHHRLQYIVDAAIMLALLYAIWLSQAGWQRPPVREGVFPPQRATGNELCDYLRLDRTRFGGEPPFLYYPKQFLNDYGYYCDLRNASERGCYQLRTVSPDGLIITGYRVADCHYGDGSQTRTLWLYCNSDAYVDLRRKVLDGQGNLAGFERFRIFSAVFDDNANLAICDISRPAEPGMPLPSPEWNPSFG